MATPVSNPCAIPYSSDAKTLRVMRLHLSDDQCRMFALLCLSASAITYPICDEQSGLLAKELSVKIRRRRESSFRSSGVKRSPRDAFSVCQVSILFSFFTSSSLGFTTCAAVESWNAAFGWHTVVTYAPLARNATYWSLVVTPCRFVPQELVRTTVLGVTMPRLRQCRSWVKVIKFPYCSICPLLNFNGFFAVSFSRSLDRNFALRSLSSLVFAKVSSARIRVSSVCTPMIPNPFS
jgi:hypothetical protein